MPQQAERIYHEVAELATRFTDLTENGSNEFYQRLFEANNLPADTYHGGEGLTTSDSQRMKLLPVNGYRRF